MKQLTLWGTPREVAAEEIDIKPTFSRGGGSPLPPMKIAHFAEFLLVEDKSLHWAAKWLEEVETLLMYAPFAKNGDLKAALACLAWSYQFIQRIPSHYPPNYRFAELERMAWWATRVKELGQHE